MTNVLDFADYPMGPKLRAFLGVDGDVYAGHAAASPSPARTQAFADALLVRAAATPPTNEEELVDLLDELLTMALPDTVLAMARAHAALLPPEDFRAALTLGVAAMMTGDFAAAEDKLGEAQELMPEEPAPYVNLVQIMCHQGRMNDAETWALAGLDAELNNLKLWDLLAHIYAEKHGDYMPERIMQLAEERAAWAGLSLAASVTSTGDRYLKANLLKKLYAKGERDGAFLVEYTAALGAAGDFEQIPAILWQAERATTQRLPWQLYVHSAQAHLAMSRTDAALGDLAKAKQDPQLPPEGEDVISALAEEARTPAGSAPVH